LTKQHEELAWPFCHVLIRGVSQPRAPKRTSREVAPRREISSNERIVRHLAAALCLRLKFVLQ
jgi:hypothetical protein